MADLGLAQSRSLGASSHLNVVAVVESQVRPGMILGLSLADRLLLHPGPRNIAAARLELESRLLVGDAGALPAVSTYARGPEQNCLGVLETLATATTAESIPDRSTEALADAINSQVTASDIAACWQRIVPIGHRTYLADEAEPFELPIVDSNLRSEIESAVARTQEFADSEVLKVLARWDVDARKDLFHMGRARIELVLDRLRRAGCHLDLPDIAWMLHLLNNTRLGANHWNTRIVHDDAAIYFTQPTENLRQLTVSKDERVVEIRHGAGPGADVSYVLPRTFLYGKNPHPELPGTTMHYKVDYVWVSEG